MARKVFVWSLVAVLAAVTGVSAQSDTDRYNEIRATEGAVGSATHGGIAEGSASWGCESGAYGFEGPLPAGWGILSPGGPIQWSKSAGCGQLDTIVGNVTNGSGDYGCAVPILTPLVAWDTSIVTNAVNTTLFELDGLQFNANYQNVDLEAGDEFAVDVTLNEGGTWTNLLTWNEDHGGVFGPGETVQLPLPPQLDNQPTVRFRFRYYDPPAGPQLGLFAQLDDIELFCTEVPVELQSFDVE